MSDGNRGEEEGERQMANMDKKEERKSKKNC
jgi:hypothetical protein